jgi:hypothetical protein
MKFERQCTLAPESSLARATQWFASNGYSVGARSNTEAHLLSAASTGRHRLSIRVAGRQLSFEFAPASPLEVLPPAGELERRVDAASREAGAAVGAGGTARRCPACATLASPGETSCSLCGSAL